MCPSVTRSLGGSLSALPRALEGMTYGAATAAAAPFKRLRRLSRMWFMDILRGGGSVLLAQTVWAESRTKTSLHPFPMPPLVFTIDTWT